MLGWTVKSQLPHPLQNPEWKEREQRAVLVIKARVGWRPVVIHKQRDVVEILSQREMAMHVPPDWPHTVDFVSS